jgi:hypothetical protein
MQPLIDGDILVYEVAFAGQYKEEDSDEVLLHSFDYVADILDEKIRQICDAVWATEEPIIYLTGSTNFRNDIAVTKPYKGNRKKEKPFHYKNLRAYMHHKYNVVMTEGIEADDAMCIEQTKRISKLDTVICSRDKDLRICEGMHFGWETGVSPQFGPTRVSYLGELRFDIREKADKNGDMVEYVHAVKGEGLKFFYAQLIMGDSTDNIPGLPKGGVTTVKAVLESCETEEELFKEVKQLYERRFGDAWEVNMLEQGRLLWMLREVNEDGSYKMWEIPAYG